MGRKDYDTRVARSVADIVVNEYKQPKPSHSYLMNIVRKHMRDIIGPLRVEERAAMVAESIKRPG